MAAARAPAEDEAKPFPSITMDGSSFRGNGVFAQAQVAYLDPHPDEVQYLDDTLAASNMGVVAHYYMDPELQGMLAAVKWPHTFIADSLAMGDAAVRMAEKGTTSIACLGVDFMAESVRATLDLQGYNHIPVYRLAESAIGCSLAESAETDEYGAWLTGAKNTPKSLHVVYINTSLVTKAQAHHLVPTVTVTSSNVVQTVLQAFAQIPDLTLYYGPDTYMGENLRALFSTIATWDNDAIRALHPAHSKDTVAALLQRLQVFQQGNCVVHHMFGDQVVDQVRRHYPDAYYSAHLEVPGEMFALANRAVAEGRGVVGSTSNILNFILDKTKEALVETPPGQSRRLEFVLGTEAGMVTPIVKGVQTMLRQAEDSEVEVEIIFPVASDAVAATGEEAAGGLSIVPGVAGGEGCSTAGGCATCPFMKMNTLEALEDLAMVVAEHGPTTANLEKFLPLRRGIKVQGHLAAELGSQPILHMRHFMANGQLSDELVNDVCAR